MTSVWASDGDEVSYDLLCKDKFNGHICNGPLKIRWISTSNPVKWGRRTACTICCVVHYEHIFLAASPPTSEFELCPLCNVWCRLFEYQGERICAYCLRQKGGMG